MPLLHRVAAALTVVVFLGACVTAPQGPRVRYAQASQEELASAEKEPVVWYEFQPGDEFPVMFVFAGMGQMGGEEIPFVVKRPFWVVVFEDGRSEISFDGETFDPNPFSRWAMMIGRGESRGNTGFLLYVGPAGEAPAELQ